MGCPLPQYIKEERRGGADPLYGAPWGVLLPSGVGFPPFHVVGVGVKEREKRSEGRRGRSPPPLVQFKLGLGGGGRSLPSLFPLKPNKAHVLPGKFP